MVLVLIIICMPLKRYKIYLSVSHRILHELYQAGTGHGLGGLAARAGPRARVRAHACGRVLARVPCAGKVIEISSLR